MESKQQFQLPLDGRGPDGSTVLVRDHAHSRYHEPLAQRQPAVPGSLDRPLPLIPPTFVALTDLPNLRAAGIAYPSTVHGWRWLFRHRHERGLDDSFRRIRRRIVVDP